MYYLGKNSTKQYKTLHNDLKSIVDAVLNHIDISVLEGHRSQERQIELYNDNRSELDGVKRMSLHQHYPSLAMDIVPYEKGHNIFDGSEKSELMFYRMNRRVFIEARRLGIDIAWGGNWESIIDMPHYQLK